MFVAALRFFYNVTLTYAAGGEADFLVAAQHPATGGWRYDARQFGDTSVTGWVLLALNSGERAGLEVAGYRGVIRFLQGVTEPGEYLMLARVDNWSATDSSSGSQCCWTNGYVRVRVTR